MGVRKNKCITTRRCHACASKIARGRIIVGSGSQPRMHEVLLLCFKNSPGHGKCKVCKNTINARNATTVHKKLPAVGLVLDRVASPECTKYFACVSKIAQGTVNAQFAKTPKTYETQRLCMVQNGPRSENGSIIVGSPECTRYCACASKIARGTLNAQLAKTPKMHETQRLCIQNGPWSENGWIIVDSPECTRDCACASKIAQGTSNAQFAKTPNNKKRNACACKMARGRRMVG